MRPMDAPCDMFCSFRLEETFPLAEALKGALASHGISLFVCAVPAGESIAKQIAHNLMQCKMALILGSETYGKETNSSFSTYRELTVIMDEKKPFF